MQMMNVKAKFHYSSFGCMCKSMANMQGYLDLNALNLSPNEKNNINFLNDLKYIYPCFQMILHLQALELLHP
jgi:hypothetical protein